MKPTLALIHGWAVSAAIWDPVLAILRKDFTVFAHALPGYGSRYQESGDLSLDELTCDAVEKIPSGAIWLGWSMGGMVALNAVIKSKNQDYQIDRLILVSSTPKFMADNDWPHGTDAPLIDGLEHKFDKDYTSALKRFLLLGLANAKQSRAIAVDAAARCMAHEPPDQATLNAGLNILRQTDLRDQLSEIDCPVQWIAGAGDQIIPAAASQWVKDSVTKAESVHMEVCNDAGHLPFLESPEWFHKVVSSTNTSTEQDDG